MKSFISKISGISKAGAYLREETEKTKILISQPLVNRIKDLKEPVKNWADIEFSCFSQWGDDGIIQYLIHKIPGLKKTFIEFGVSNYLESNTRFLLMNNNWRGLILDGSEQNIDFIRNDSVSWKYDLTAECLFITRSNINQAISQAGFSGETGILHIDIDGNDYWLWEAVNAVDPQIVIMEYNSLFGSEHAISVPYQDDFFVTNAHYSNIFFGASLPAMNHLAMQKGYVFVGSNTAGNNAYFVKETLINDWVRPVKMKEGFVACNFRQNRDKEGKLTLQRDDKMIYNCGDLEVIEVSTGEKSPLKNYLK